MEHGGAPAYCSSIPQLLSVAGLVTVDQCNGDHGDVLISLYIYIYILYICIYIYCEFPLVAQVPLLEQQSEAFERCRHMRLREPREKAGRDFRALLP